MKSKGAKERICFNYKTILLLAAGYNIWFAFALLYFPATFEGFINLVRVDHVIYHTDDKTPILRLAALIMAMGGLYCWCQADLRRAPAALTFGIASKLGPVVWGSYRVFTGAAPASALKWLVVNDLIWLPLFYIIGKEWIESIRKKNEGEIGLRQVLIHLSETDASSASVAVILTAVVGTLGVVFSIYSLYWYGIALFLLMPFFLGMFAALLYSIKHERTLREAMRVYQLALVWTLGFLLAYAIEGVICVVMAAPLLLVMGAAGCAVGCAIQRRQRAKRIHVLVLLALLNPALMHTEQRFGLEPSLRTVTSRVEVQASPADAWHALTSNLDIRPEVQFQNRIGVTAPQICNVRSKNEHEVLHCTLQEGEVELLISESIKEKLLVFNPVRTPPPMKELSVFEIHAPHLTDAFTVTEGSIKFIESGRGTILEATTKYRHRIWPPGYWSLWSSFIIDQMHNSVLNAVKKGAERE